MAGFLAFIIPLDPGASAPGQPAHPIAAPTVTHPIAPGGPPPGYWGGVAPPQPTHPIAPGGPPPGYWGGVAPPQPTPPIWIPIPPPPGGAKPEHPIYYPPVIWPEPPQKPQPGEPPLEAKIIWTPQTGWG